MSEGSEDWSLHFQVVVRFYNHFARRCLLDRFAVLDTAVILDFFGLFGKRERNVGVWSTVPDKHTEMFL